MKCISRGVTCLVGSCALVASTAALADNPLGLYVGAGVGTAQIGNNYDDYNYGYGGGFRDHDAAWKVIAGLRPISILGAELEYIDFGNATGNDGYYGGNYDYSVSAHPKATVLYGLGYLPIPLPFIDVYGKLGVARLETDNSYLSGAQPGYGTCVINSSECNVSVARFERNNTRFAYGAGVQAKWQDFAFRGEYERIDSTYGDPNAFTVSLTWTF